MKAVVLAAGKGTRLRPLTDDRPKGLVDVDGAPLLTHCFDQLRTLDIDGLVVVVGYEGDQIVDHFGESYEGIPITYVRQEEQLGLAHALLLAEPHVDEEFVLMLGDNIFRADLQAVVDRQRTDQVDAAFLVEEVEYEEASRYGVCVTDEEGAITSIVEKPEEPPSNLVMTGFYSFTPAIFHACHLVQPSDRGEYELADAIDLLIRSGRRIEAIPMAGWRIDVGYPEDRDRAEQQLQATENVRRAAEQAARAVSSQRDDANESATESL